jgi:hypothetical protein
MRSAVGTRPASDILVEFVDASTYDECIRLVDDYEIDLMLLDGEAAPAGGIQVDGTLVHPLDPIETGRTVAAMLRSFAATA